jgi:hypothetical protein
MPPRWDAECKNRLKMRFMKLYEDESHSPDMGVHPLCNDKEWKLHIFKELFEPKGFEKKQFQRHYEKCLNEFHDEIDIHERRKASIGETDSMVNEIESGRATEEKNEKMSAKKKKKKKKEVVTHPFIVPKYSEDIECLLPITHWVRDKTSPETEKYYLQLPKGLTYDDDVDVSVSNKSEFCIEFNHHPNWFNPELMMSNHRILAGNAYTWQCAFSDAIKDGKRKKVRMKVMTPFRIEHIKQKEFRYYHDKKGANRLIKKLMEVENRIRALEQENLTGEDLNSLRSDLASGQHMLQNPNTYVSVMEVTVTNLDQIK